MDRAFALKRVPRNEHLFDEGPIEPEDLQPVVRSVGDIDHVVMGHQDGVHGIVEPGGRRPLNQLCARRELDAVVRPLAVGAPVTFIGAGVRIKDDDAAIEVAVGTPPEGHGTADSKLIQLPRSGSTPTTLPHQ